MHFSENELNGFFRYCVALTGNEADAYDLLQDSLEKLLKQGSGIRSRKAYLLRIIRNRFLDARRAEKRAPTVELPESIVSLNEPSLEQLTANREEVRILLQDLAEDDRELLYLWGVEEYTAQELADLFGCPRGTVLSRLHRLKKKIKNYLQRPGAQDHEKTAGA